ncbi:HTH-type transcriptional activator CmpR [Paenibacillus solanacearum]|uniref:HTH-type transcriptional activator CmpR n=1 Tax=Paenibacillus solanacearum TaxID=2048548 RepID=A0A916NSI2_9BACL|nr:LysR family transcriptional regulator [Paenibacillus solanacearum]CAG7649563.1 HTH-type transcriptional activator CmpR [Paenibacillus solanacearum]
MISLELYKVFHAIARTGNISKAAELLYITQPSVSYAIKQLEEQLGTALFVRKPKGVELTPEGRALLDYVQPALTLLTEGERLMARYHSLDTGEIRIGGSEMLIKHYLLPAIESFHDDYPGVRFRFVHGKTLEIAGRLEEGSIDIGLVHLPLPAGALQIHHEWQAEPIFIGSGRDKLRFAQPHEPAELFKLPMILLSPGSSTRKFVDKEAQACGGEIVPEMEVGSIELIKEMVRVGFGIAILHKNLAEAELAAGNLLEIPLTRPLTMRSIALVSPAKRELSAAASVFTKRIQLP